MNELMLGKQGGGLTPFVPGTWEKGTRLITGLHGAASAYDDNDYIYIYGGKSGVLTEDRLYRYDVVNSRLSLLSASGQMPGGVWVAAAAYYDGFLYIHGGESQNVNNAEVQLHRFDPETESYVRLADGPSRIGHSMVAVDGRLLIFGGVEEFEIKTEVWAYDIATDTWSVLTDSLASWLRSTVIDKYAGNKIITTGGCDPLTNRGIAYVNQSMAPPYVELNDWMDFPSPRYGHVTGVIRHGLLIFGGTSNDGERFGLLHRDGSYTELELPNDMTYPFTPIGHMTKAGFVVMGGVEYANSIETVLDQIWTYKF